MIRRGVPLGSQKRHDYFARIGSHFHGELPERGGLAFAITIRLSIHLMREFEVSDLCVCR